MSNPQVRQQILAARALVLPSFAEGLPVVIMESLALHRPVISTYVAAIPELVRPGESGWLVSPGDVDGLAHAMKEALTTPVAKLAQMGAIGAAAVAQRHSAATESEKLASLFAPSSRMRGEGRGEGSPRSATSPNPTTASSL
jgi:colanic acid/amylovoran biosynthesis glycosyltransferase